MASCLIVLTLACACSAAEPMEASFCDMWPLAVGNQWTLVPIQAECGLTVGITQREQYKDVSVWQLKVYSHGVTDVTIDTYWFFLDGWVYQTMNAIDLAGLPEIGGGMRRVFPEVFRSGEEFTIEALFGDDEPLEVSTVVSDTGVRLYTRQGQLCLPLNRGAGPGFYPNETVLFGTCSGLYETHVSALPWAEVGQALRMSVPRCAGTDFQWYKDGAAIEGATASIYVKSPADFDDSGSYTCRVSDQTKSFHDTPPAEVTVFEEGILPAFGAVGIGAAVLGCLVLGVRGILRRKSLNVGGVR